MSTFRLSTTASACLLSTALLAQVPQAISYQAVVRDPASGLPLANTAGTVRFVLHNGTPTGPMVYSEDQAFSANDQGLFTAAIGAMASTSGPFDPSAWSSLVFLEVQLDIGSTGAFTSMGTQQLLSVPFALRSAHSNLPDGTEVGQVAHWDGGAWVVDSGLYVHQRRLGIGTAEPEAPLEIKTGGGGYKLFSVTGQPTPVGEAKFTASLPETTGANGFDLAEDTAGGSASRLFIQRSTGNIGLGTSEPAEKLHVQDANDGGTVGIRIVNTAASGNDGWSLSVMDDNAVAERVKTFMVHEKTGSDLTERITLLPVKNMGINEPMPYATLHVTKPTTDPTEPVSLSENTGIAILGPLSQHLVMDSRSIQARLLLGGATSLSGSAGSLRLQPLGGDLIVHDAATSSDAKVVVKDNGNVGIGTLSPPGMITVGKRDQLKTYFETGDIPTEDDFSFRLTDSTGFSIEQGTPGTSASRLFIQQGTGHVGIGTTTPLERHHVHAVHHGGSVGMRVSNGAVSSNGGWSLGHVDDEMIPERSGAFALMEAPGSGGGAGGSRMVVMPGGNVGINEVLPYATLHVSKPTTDPTEPLSLSENTGIAILGPLSQHLVMDSRSIQARHLLGGATSLTGSAGSLRLQPLGGDLIVHDAATSSDAKVVVKDNGNVGIGTSTPTASLHVASSDASPGNLVVARITNEGTTTSTSSNDHRVGVQISCTGLWGGDPLSKDIGLYVSAVNGQSSSSSNLAAVLNGNTVIGDLQTGSSLVGANGSRVLAIQNGTAPSSAPNNGSGLPDGGVQLWSASDAMGTSVFHVMNGNGDVLSLAKQNPLYAADMGALNPIYDAGTAAIIDNMRTRINQLEAILKNLGVLEP